MPGGAIIQKNDERKVLVMRNENLKKMIMTAVFAALVCIATMLIQIPTFVTNGYVNLGDGVILLASWMLGPWFGFLAGGIGSALADLLLGYTVYAPGTFLIKGLIALISGLTFRAVSKMTNSEGFLAKIPGAVLGEVEMVLGYFLYEALPLGYGLAAAASMVSNAVQGLAGVVIALAAVSVLSSAKLIGKNGALRVR